MEAQHPAVTSRLAWHSLDRRLPLLISALLAVTVLLLAAGAYQAMRGVLLAASRARLEVAARQLTSLMRASAAQSQAELDALAATPEVRTLLAAPGDEGARAAAERRLTAMAAQPESMTLELVDAEKHPVLALRGPVEMSVGAGGPQPASATPGLSPLRVAGGAVYYDLAAVVMPAASTPPGRLVARRLISSPNGTRTFATSIGSDARLLLGNLDGDLWTDFSTVVSPPVTVAGSPPTARATVVDDGRQLTVALAIPRTPWQVCLQAPRAAALAPARAFFGRLAAISLLLTFLGAVAARWFSRKITAPLERLTAAADGLAAGEFDLQLLPSGRDELGRLSEVFEAMRQRIVADHQRLEQRVEQRTAELSDTLAELEQAQAELVRAERLAILGQLASSVGHELRNPLAVMTNGLFYLEMVLGDHEGDVHEYLGILRHEIRLSEKIVSDLLDFARLKVPQRERVQLADVVDEQLYRLGHLPSVRVEWQPPLDLPAVFVDPVQIGQVFLNLVINATQAMSDAGGVLRVEVQSAGTDRVELVVRDQGPGVPEPLRQRIFEPLFTTKARGIGLGLAVSRRLAESNGGELVLLDALGPGAAFALRLPAAHAESA